MEYWGRCLKHAYAISIVVLVHISASLSLFHHYANATRCVDREREALLAIKQDLVDEYHLLSSWGSGSDAQKQDCCRWERVYCDNQTGHVLRLDLGADQHWQFQVGEFTRPQLQGKINPKLIELKHLTYLDLSNNDFNGSQIPPLIGSLTNLRYLDLNDARFGGQIPYHQLGNLTHLQYLNLGDNYLFHYVENLNWLPHLSSLKYLDLSDINLSNVFDWLKTVNKLPNLRNLTLASCDLPPPILSTLSHINTSQSLATVDLRYNNVTSSLFKWLCNYNTTLLYLDLHINKLSGSLPDVFGNMSSLALLSLSDNQLEEGIPDSFAKLCGLQYLDISWNNLRGHISNFFESSCAQNSLETLIVSGNHLAGPFPDLTKFLALKTLYLFGNQLSGTIPESIGQLSNLETFSVGNNHLDGVISETHFSRLSKLQWMDLSSNSLVLDFHPEWVPPFQVDHLYLDSCKMGPLFPKWLRTQKNLKSLTIADAGISESSIPSWFWDWSRNITEIDLSSNEIKGTLLADSGFEFAYEPGLNLSWNQLEGPIPSFLSKASSLDLSNNKLSKVDSFLCSTNVSNLNFLDLSSNQVSGEVPDCWKHFEHLVFLDLSNNEFSGNIPTTMSSLSSIETLKLDNNRFAGELPSSLKNCTNLRALDLESNELSGPIPKWLGVEVSNLAILILRSNHFNGSMPSQLCHLTSIQVLDLSINNLTGSIPICLNNLTTLAQKGNPNLTIGHRYTSGRQPTMLLERNYDDEVSIMWKGVLSKYKSILGLVKSIDLSSNKLTGEIPSAITELVGLVSLNLSRNHLTGQITPNIGKLQSLDSLDISRNQIHGAIPTSLARIDRLAYLDLSYNDLSGEIPTGTQLQGFNPSIYAGNSWLCGLPLKNICDPKETGRPNVSSNQEDSDELITQDFYISVGLGFAIGFWGVCGSLIFKRSWRYAYYEFLNASNDWLHVKVSLIRRKLKDVLNG